MKDDSEAAAARLVTGIIISPSGHLVVYSTLQQPNIKLSRHMWRQAYAIRYSSNSVPGEKSVGGEHDNYISII